MLGNLVAKSLIARATFIPFCTSLNKIKGRGYFRCEILSRGPVLYDPEAAPQLSTITGPALHS